MEQSNAFAALETPLRPADLGTFAWSGALLAAITLLSFFSGFHAFSVPWDLAWQFSPIGMLQGIRPENLELPSQGFFTGRFGYTPDYLIVFLKTCLFEAPFYLWCLRGLPWPRRIALLLSANFLTHPLIFFVVPTLFERYITAALVSEAFAPGIEMIFIGLILARARSRKAAWQGALAVLLANLFSWEVGMFL